MEETINDQKPETRIFSDEVLYKLKYLNEVVHRLDIELKHAKQELSSEVAKFQIQKDEEFLTLVSINLDNGTYEVKKQ